MKPLKNIALGFPVKRMCEMPYINKNGYLERSSCGGKRNPTGKGTKRDWYLVKAGCSEGARGWIGINGKSIYLPKEFIGKKIRFKVELL